jgi:signal transduction histidine kinase
MVEEKIRILVVEDSPTQAENLRYILRQKDYEVYVARNGQEALKIIGGVRPAIVISDIIMPEMDGFQLCREIRADNKPGTIPIILLTALSDPEDVLRGLECGADHFITKPFDEKYLLSKIGDILKNADIRNSFFQREENEFFYKGEQYVINSGRQQILNLLLSTYELAVIKNQELKTVQEKLESLNEHLEKMVSERTNELAEMNEKLKIEIAEHQKAKEALQESEKQLRYLASQLLTAHEDERKRIALEVHDVLGSSLSAIKFKVEEALHGRTNSGCFDISKSLESVIPVIQDTIEAARRIQSDLRPPLLDDLGIIATLSWFCRRFETIYSGIRIEQEIFIREKEVPDYLKIALFRVAQEAMNNIGKHAGADHVVLRLRKINGTIELTIRDNGKGFKQENLLSGEGPKKGLGLSSMKERTQFSGGSFSFESIVGKGTTVRAVWPIG